jgi:hypothetical protein
MTASPSFRIVLSGVTESGSCRQLLTTLSLRTGDKTDDINMHHIVHPYKYSEYRSTPPAAAYLSMRRVHILCLPSDFEPLSRDFLDPSNSFLFGQCGIGRRGIHIDRLEWGEASPRQLVDLGKTEEDDHGCENHAPLPSDGK